MDSITQIVLGAAVGEVTLGKKVGNRAMVWGAIAGTIPDLDIISNAWMSEIDSLAFHRGISHSFVFAIVGAFLFGWLVYKMYQTPYHKWIGMISWMILSVGIGSVFLFSDDLSWIKGLIGILVGVGGTYWIYRRYQRPAYRRPKASLRDWQWLFFWGLVTHPILDTFTAYGTQLFAPFSNYRAAISNISVADPIYTILFATPLVILVWFDKENPIRRKLVWIGIILSSLYMIWTLYNKFRVTQVMKETLVAENIDYREFFTSPSILNNILWSGVAETADAYYHGQYSLWDTEPKFKLKRYPKNHHLLEVPVEDDHVLSTLAWFSDGYYAVIERADGDLQINDMRYGTFRGEGDSEDDFIFNFPIRQQADGSYELIKAQGGPPEDVDMGQMANDLWNRIKGI